jgi:poly(3-hydroxybutyrate) depolymerase
MLYAMHEFNYAVLSPWNLMAQANLAALSSPWNAFAGHPLHSHLAASNDLFTRMTRRYEKPEFGITEILEDGHSIAIAQKTVIERPFCRLLHFNRADAPAQPRPKVLIVAPLSGHHSTLLRDTVRTFVHDHEVWITDWTDARSVPLSAGSFHFDDFVNYVRDFIHVIGPDTHVVAVCQPAVPVMAAVSLMAAAKDPLAPSSMTLMGGPIDTRTGPTSVNRFAEQRSSEWFERNFIQTVPLPHKGFMRQVYPGFLQHACFVAMNADKHVKAYRDYFNHLVEGDDDSAAAHRVFYDEYNAVLDLPGEFYLDTVRIVFQNHDLPKGTLVVNGQPVQPALITKTALFTVEGERDDITGQGQTVAAHDLCSGLAPGQKKHFLALGVGHYGIFNGRKFREMIYPQVRDFIREHGHKTAAAT